MNDNDALRLRREQGKAEAVREIRAAIADLKTISRPLDKWQRVQLARAIGEGFAGVYGMSRCSARLVTWPADNRNDALIEEEPEIARMTLSDFEGFVDELAAEPARLHPIFFFRR